MGAEDLEVSSHPDFSLGPADNKWQNYQIRQYPIDLNGNDTGYKAILREGSLVSIVRQGYMLLPNEEALKLADEAAALAGLVPFDKFTGDWYQRMEKHTILDKEGRRMHALYAINKPYTVNGEKMHLGVGIHNSIDGSTAFGAGIFTFRNACANMVLAGTKNYEQAFDQRRTLEYVYHRHTAKLAPVSENLKNIILLVMDRAQEIIASYRQMAARDVTAEFAEKLKKSRLSKKVLPEYLTAEEPTVQVDKLTEWQLYNDITEKIWHNADSGLRTKEFQFTTLHKLMPLQVVKA